MLHVFVMVDVGITEEAGFEIYDGKLNIYNYIEYFSYIYFQFTFVYFIFYFTLRVLDMYTNSIISGTVYCPCTHQPYPRCHLLSSAIGTKQQ